MWPPHCGLQKYGQGQCIVRRANKNNSVKKQTESIFQTSVNIPNQYPDAAKTNEWRVKCNGDQVKNKSQTRL